MLYFVVTLALLTFDISEGHELRSLLRTSDRSLGDSSRHNKHKHSSGNNCKDTCQYGDCKLKGKCSCWVGWDGKNCDVPLMCGKDLKDLEWINEETTEFPESGEQNPTNRLDELTDIYGPPDTIDRESGGVAIWKKETLEKLGSFWYRIELHDEQIPHALPVPHFDFLYEFFELEIPNDSRYNERLLKILNLSNTITYDGLKQLIRARCHFEGANIATVFVAKKVINDEMEGTQDEYANAIFSVTPGSCCYDPNARQQMIDYLING